MYEYVNDKKFLSRMRSLCGELMQDLCHTLKSEYDIGSSFYLVGSGARNLIMQNADRPIDLDYNLEIVRIDDFENSDISMNVLERHLIWFLANTDGVIAKIQPHL